MKQFKQEEIRTWFDRRIDADTLASWSSGHTLLADNRDNHGTFSLSFGEIADRINEFFGVQEPPEIE